MPAHLKSFMRNSDCVQKKNILSFLAFEKRVVTILNMVSERYPREEDEECASAYGSENCEENQVQNDDSSSVFATMANNDPDIVFGNFHQESNLEKVQMLSINTINPSIEGNSIKIGAITCFIDSAISQSIVPAFSSPITVERQYDGNI
jgi:hypothetical protein